ncbi:GNAT family N-acetyltransferase [Kocuria rosea]|uniref:GNAT family N-acetyltransferase n=1 Tax=Kocuria rosea TaxID=1275 RepID=UPI000D65DE38|nr:GNAT family N-acetyltransferase [Kocuria rosea]PWF80164.1 hypothetical protein DEJ37_16960 [Kocuria rosea]STX03453.1 Acetyltransferase (GNAT) family [Kocuria rosea]
MPAEEAMTVVQNMVEPALPKRVVLRSARLSDLFVLLDLADQVGYHLNPEWIRHRLQTDPNPEMYLVATISDTPVAAAQLQLVPPHQPQGAAGRARLTALAVDEDHRGAGLGPILLTACEDHARMLGAHVLEIALPSSRPPMDPFWRHHGYRPLPPALYAKPLAAIN